MCVTKLFTKDILLIGALLITQAVSAQENPWKTSKSGSNPWGETTEQKEEKETPKAQEKVEPVVTEKETKQPEPQSKEVEAGPQIIVIEKEEADEIINEYRDLHLIEAQARKDYEPIGTGVSTFVTSALLNVFSLPINAIIGTAPSYQSNSLKRQFDEDNPHATAAQRRAYRRGLRKERGAKAGIGTGVGIMTNFLLIFAISRS
jgi:hypothetical protein